jgi:hypothetical protein
VQACIKRRAKAIVLKMDFRKAFDYVDWGLWMPSWQQKGFPSVWRNWIHLLNVSGQTTVVFNGVPSKWI